MPVFFIITGFLINVDDISFGKLVRKKVKTILIPYYFFAIITFVFWYFIETKFEEPVDRHQDVINYSIGLLLGIPSKEYLGFNFPIWYLPSLFCSELLFFAIRKFFAKYAILPIILSVGIGIFLTEIHFIRLPYGIDVSLFSILFIYIGYISRKRNWIEKGISSPRPFLKIILILGFLLLTIIVSQVNTGEELVSMVKRSFNNYLLFFIGGLSGTLFLLYLGSFFNKSAVFNFFGRNTVIILGFHLMTLTIIKGIQVFALKTPLSATDNNFIMSLAYTVLVFLLLTPVIYFINRYIPSLLGRKKAIL